MKLHDAAKAGDADATRAMDAPDTGARDERNMTALDRAAARGHIEAGDREADRRRRTA